MRIFPSREAGEVQGRSALHGRVEPIDDRDSLLRLCLLFCLRARPPARLPVPPQAGASPWAWPA